jgi:DNA-binding transcriptional regulator YiaG
MTARHRNERQPIERETERRPTERQRVRRAAGITQAEGAVRAHVSPMLFRNWERFGDAAVEDPEKLARIHGVRDWMIHEGQRRGQAAA